MATFKQPLKHASPQSSWRRYSNPRALNSEVRRRILCRRYLVLRGVRVQPNENTQSLQEIVINTISFRTGMNLEGKVLAVGRMTSGNNGLVKVYFANVETRDAVARKRVSFSQQTTKPRGLRALTSKLYLDDYLTPMQLEERRRLWSVFHELKQAGQRPSWRQEVLFHFPPGATKAVPYTTSTPASTQMEESATREGKATPIPEDASDTSSCTHANVAPAAEDEEEKSTEERPAWVDELYLKLSRVDDALKTMRLSL